MIRYMCRFLIESMHIHPIKNRIIQEDQHIDITEGSIILRDTEVIRVHTRDHHHPMKDIRIRG